MLLGEVLIGIHFHTLQPLPHLLVKSNISTVCSSILIHVKDYEFNLYDYHAYVQEQARILSSPQGHVALLEGGLIGWIAKEHLGHHSVSLRPSSVITNHCQGFSFMDTAGTTYWDDRLMDNKIHLICKMYHSYTGTYLHIFIYIFY